MRDFSALCARVYRLSANSRATISSTAIFLSQQSRQYFSSPRGSDTSFAPHNAQRDFATALRDIYPTILQPHAASLQLSSVGGSSRPAGFDDHRAVDAGRLVGNGHPLENLELGA